MFQVRDSASNIVSRGALKWDKAASAADLQTATPPAIAVNEQCGYARLMRDQPGAPPG